MLQPKFVCIEQVPDDAVMIDSYYKQTDTGAIELQIPLISQLPRGHRQYLTVQDPKGQLLSQHILDAQSLPLLLPVMD